MTSPAITEIMTVDPDTIERASPISEAYDILQRAPFHHLIVVEGDDPVGMVASSDVLRLVYDADGTSETRLRAFLDHQFSIEDAMSEDLQTLPTTASVQDAAAAMADGRTHSVVVLDDGALAGIVTTTDLVRYVRDNG
ncbi:MAG: CBS domain-containing protein [Actinomycetota bacterium]